MSWLDLIFPPTCIACEQAGDWLCEKCLDSIRLRPHANEAKPPFQAVLTCGSYADPVLRQLVTSFKYRSAKCLKPVWSRLLKKYRDNFMDPWPWAGLSELVVTSIPGDLSRMRRRGFDHAAAIADAVQEVLVPWAERQPLLFRTRPSVQNANLPHNASRIANIGGVFAALGPVTRPVLLVDDVMTTGATSLEAARVLLAAGAPAVYLLVMAEG